MTRQSHEGTIIFQRLPRGFQPLAMTRLGWTDCHDVSRLAMTWKYKSPRNDGIGKQITTPFGFLLQKYLALGTLFSYNEYHLIF